jgi:AraC-like DNA-binding protein
MPSIRFREKPQRSDPGAPIHVYSLQNRGNRVFPCHWHPEFEFILVESGRLDLKRGNRMIRLRAGEVACIGPKELHAGQAGPGGCVCSPLLCSPSLFRSTPTDSILTEWIDPLCSGRLALPERLVRRLPEHAECIRSLEKAVRLALSLREESPQGAEILLRGYVMELFGRLAMSGGIKASAPEERGLSATGGDRLRKVLGHMERHLSDRFTIDSLAAIACLSRSAFSRYFKGHTGETVVEYLNGMRVASACELLSRTDWPIWRIAEEVGFGNLSYFARSFKRYAGIKPSDWRKYRGQYG